MTSAAIAVMSTSAVRIATLRQRGRRRGPACRDDVLVGARRVPPSMAER
jgi:hypothetical protein